MGWEAALAGAGIGAVSNALGGGKDDPDLQPWKPVGHGLKRNFFPRVDEFSNDFARGNTLFSGSRLANLQPIRNALDFQAGQLPGLQKQMNQAGQSIQGFIDYDPNSPINQARRESFADQAMANFNQNIRPAIEDRATFAGQFGGPQSALALGTAAQGVTRDINEFEAQMMENDRARALQATAIAPSIFAQRLMPTDRLINVGQQRVGLNQMELEDRIQQSEAGFNNRLKALSAVQGLYAPFSGLASSGGGGGPNMIQSILGGAALGSQFDFDFGNIFGGGGGGSTDWGFGSAGDSNTMGVLSDLGIL